MNTKELLQKHFEALRKEEAEFLAKTVDLKAEREKWNVVASEANAKAMALTGQIHAIERPEGGRTLLDVKRDLAAVANSLGAMRLSENA